MTPQRPLSYRTTAITILVAATVIAATIVSYASFEATVTRTSFSTSTITTTIVSRTTSISTVTVTAIQTLGTASIQEELGAECSNSSNSGTFPTVTAGTDSAAVLCVRAYFFSSNETYTLNASGVLSIDAFSANNTYFDGASNFTVISDPSQTVIGGASNENEGAVMAFAVIPNPGASGTYEIGLGSTWVLGPTGPEQCGYYGQLVAGTGQPNYIIKGFSGCIAYTVSSSGGGAITNSTEYTVINNYVLYNDALYLQVSGSGSIPV